MALQKPEQGKGKVYAKDTNHVLFDVTANNCKEYQIMLGI